MATFHRFLLLPVVATILVSIVIPLQVTCYAADLAATKTVRVAAVQFVSEFGKAAENSKGLESLAREAAQNGAKIIVLPEAAIPGYMSHDMRQTWQVDDRSLSESLQGTPAESVAESVPGPSTDAFGSLAKELGVYLTVPVLEIDVKQKKYFNTLVLMGPDGKIALHYRKLHPYLWAEQGWASPGDHGHQIVDTPYGRVSVLVCFDIHSEPPTLKVNHVDHLLFPIAWVDYADSKWFSESLPNLAKQVDVNIIGANWSVSKRPEWNGYGQSVVIGRDGRILAKAKSDLGNQIVYAELPIPVSTVAQDWGFASRQPWRRPRRANRLT